MNYFTTALITPAEQVGAGLASSPPLKAGGTRTGSWTGLPRGERAPRALGPHRWHEQTGARLASSGVTV